MPTETSEPRSGVMSSETTPMLGVTSDDNLMDMLKDDPMTLGKGLSTADKEQPTKRPSIARRSLLGEIKSAAPTTVDPVDRITKLQEEHFADDLELPPEAYTKWSDEEIVAFFENGGIVPKPSEPRAAAVSAKPISMKPKIELSAFEDDVSPEDPVSRPHAAAVSAKSISTEQEIPKVDNTWPFSNMACTSIFDAMPKMLEDPQVGDLQCPNLPWAEPMVPSWPEIPKGWPMSNVASESIFHAIRASV